MDNSRLPAFELLLQMKELQLNSLFEIIRAINANASEEHLYKIFKFTLHSDRNIAKMALFVSEEGWSNKAGFSTPADFPANFSGESFAVIEQTGRLPENLPDQFYREFNTVIAVRHKRLILACVFLQLDDYESEIALADRNFIEAMSNIIIVAIENKKLARRQQKQEALKRQLDIARDVQTLLFPKKLPYNRRLSIEASYKPHHSVGGDYYDYIPGGEDKFLLAIADVSGKGVPAAILMSNFQAALRTLAKAEAPLEKIVRELNSLILENSGGENFITAFFAEYDFRNRRLRYVNAGHNPPFLLRPEENCVSLEDGTTVLGSFSPLPFLEVGLIEDLEEFFLFCFTDGYTETANEAGREFGPELLARHLEKYRVVEQHFLHKKLIELLQEYKGNNHYADDITLLSCRVNARKSASEKIIRSL